jgi:mono/diheme cytochrome c family protein
VALLACTTVLVVLRQLVPLALAAGAVAGACAPDTPTALRTGRDVYGDNCSSCHGDSGGGGVGPSLENVLATWPSCADQIEWITLGSSRWKVVHGTTYGANETPIGGVMPGHDETLSPDEIAAVAAFERVQYGGGDEATELAACGIDD